MEELALAIGRERCRVRLGEAPVHVPLDVGDRGTGQDLAEHPEEVVHHVRAGHVEHELLAALRPRPAGDAERPVRVLGEQPAPRVDHLGLDPQAELEAQVEDPSRHGLQPARQLAPVDDPVAERARVVVPLPEPAVVEDEELDPQVARRGRHLDQGVLGEVEVDALPAVEEDRPGAIPPRAPGQPPAEQAVRGVGQLPEAVGRVHEDRLGRHELLARREGPGKAVRLDPDPDAGRGKGVHLGLGAEVAGVDEAEPVGLAVLLGRRGSLQDHEGVVLVARRAAQAAHRLPAGGERSRRDVALARPGPVERHQVPGRVGQVEDGAHRAADAHRRRPAVADRRAAGDHRVGLEDRVGQANLDATRLVGEVHLDGRCLCVILDVRGREPAQPGLPGEHAVPAVREVKDRRAVGRLDHQRRDAEVAAAAGGVLAGERVADPVGESLEGPAGQVGVGAAGPQRRAEVQVPEGAVLEHPGDVADPPVAEVHLVRGSIPGSAHRHPRRTHGSRRPVSRHGRQAPASRPGRRRSAGGRGLRASGETPRRDHDR